MGKLKYSFIIPVYNCVNYLEQCVKSILDQNFINIEILLIDDGSTDGSSNLCDNYAQKYENIYVFHKKNGGVSSARNYGIEKAQGEYILFIDGDDTLEKSMLQDIEKKISEDSQLLIYGMTFDYYNANILERTEKMTYPQDPEITVEELGQKFYNYYSCNRLSSSCDKVFLKRIIDQYNIRFDENMHLYEDFEFVLRYLKYVRKITCLNEGYYHYRLLPKEKHLSQRVKNLDILIESLRKIKIGIQELEKYIVSSYTGEEVYVQLVVRLLYAHLLHTNDVKHAINVIQMQIRNDGYLNEVSAVGKGLSVNEEKFYKYAMSNRQRKFIFWVYEKRVIHLVKDKFRPLAISVKKVIGKN